MRPRPTDAQGMTGLVPPAGHGRRDAGGIVVGWLVKLVVVVGLVGVALFDAISIGVSRLSVEDAGALAAREASTSLARTGNLQSAYETAVHTAWEANELNDIPPSTFVALPDGSVQLVVSREATTFVVRHVGWMRPWAHVEAEANGKPMP